jgi:hypothetical protein
MIFFRRKEHLRDEELLLLQEGELSQREQKRVEAHLGRCDHCRNRRSSLMGAEVEMQQHHTLGATATPPKDNLRQQLQSRLDGVARGDDRSLWIATLLRPRMLFRLATVVALLALSFAWRQAYSPLQDRMGAYEETGPKPDHNITPGATRSAELSELCVLADDDLDPRVPPEKERAVFQAYGIDERASHAYQVDYLINPQLGGDDELENLWPEPYHATVWNATAKDALETRLHGMVCSGKIGLQQAQQELATDWIVSYKRHFHADRPVSTVAIADIPRALTD